MAMELIDHGRWQLWLHQTVLLFITVMSIIIYIKCTLIIIFSDVITVIIILLLQAVGK